jgi:hypothetical protein
MPFEIEETSSIKAEGPNYYKEHNQLSDAMEHAINWLANKSVGTKVTITETTTVKRKT